MGKDELSAPLPPGKLVDLGFLDARSKLLDLAAFLDRIERGGDIHDFRLAALREAVTELASPESGRARRILELLSDPTTEPAPTAATQSACGAPPPPVS